MSKLRTRFMLWTPCVAMLLLSFISYVDRSVLSILSPTILHSIGLNAQQYGEAISVFSICYMLANPVWGYWIDRVGLFAAISSAVLLWSLASGAHAFVTGLAGLCLARGLLGFGEGATFPAGLKAVTETLPVEKRSFGLGLAYSGGSLGAALTPIFITPLAMKFGWRSTFVLTAVIGFLWVGFWLLLRRTGLYRPVPSRVRVRPEWNRNLFATAAVYGLGAAPLAFGLYAAPLYLSHVLHQTQTSLGHLLWIPPAGWEAGYLFWGRVADRRRLLSRGSPLRWFVLFAAGSFLLGVIPLCSGLLHGLLLTMALFFLVMFLAGGFVVLSLTHGTATQLESNTGFLAGFSISSWSLITALIMPVIGRMFDHGDYSRSFWVIAALPSAGVLLWWLLSTAESEYHKTREI
jgi:MFS transporter, ACS family, hexuronate transporter